MLRRLSQRGPLVILAGVIFLLLIAALTQFGGRTSLPTGPSTASSSASTSSSLESMSASTSRTSTSSTQQSSASSSTSSALDFFRIGLGEVYGTLFVTPSVEMNYSIKISYLDTLANPVNLTLSAFTSTPGVTVTMSPSELAFVGTEELLTLGISLAPSVNASTMPVEIIASSAGGAINSTFNFFLDKSLIVVTPLGNLAPSTLHVTVGQTVTWLNLMYTQEGDPVVANVALADGSAASPTMSLNDLWSHTFDQPGTYSYQVTLTGTPTASGVVVVG